MSDKNLGKTEKNVKRFKIPVCDNKGNVVGFTLSSQTFFERKKMQREMVVKSEPVVAISRKKRF